MSKLSSQALLRLRQLPPLLRTWLVPTTLWGWLSVASVVALIGLALYASRYDAPRFTLGLAFLVPELLLVGALLRKLQFRWLTVLAIWLCLFSYAIYFSYTNYNERNFDAKAQLEYIQYMAENWRAPPASKCFVCHHPPLYYGGAAAFYALFEATDLASPTRGAQVWSLLCHITFLIFSALILRRMLPDQRLLGNQRLLALCVLLVGLWPSGIINSVRVHNDVMFNALYAVALHSIVCWYQDRRLRQFLWATVLSGVCVVAKMNGLALIATLGTALLYVLWKRDVPMTNRDKRLSLLAMLGLGAVLAAYTSMREPVLRKSAKKADKKEQVDEKQAQKDDANGGDDDAAEGEAEEGAEGANAAFAQRLLGSAYNIGPSLWVGNSPANYMYLDLESYREDPYVYAKKDEGGRQYHWNHVLKSSLFPTRNEAPDGETSYAVNRALAEALDWLLLVLLACIAGAGLSAKRASLHRYLILWLSSAQLVLLSVGFKALVPSSHHADFRFIFPIITTGSLFLGLALSQFRRRELILSPLARIATWSFMVLSFVYFLPKAAFITRLSTPKGTLTKELAEVSKVKAPRTVWDKKGNTIIPDGYELALTVAPPLDDVLTVEFTLDHNDSYEITLQGTEGERHLVVGPYEKPKFAGLARYEESFDEPLNGVTLVKVRPLAGDSYYSLGHLLLKTGQTQ